MGGPGHPERLGTCKGPLRALPELGTPTVPRTGGEHWQGLQGESLKSSCPLGQPWATSHPEPVTQAPHLTEIDPGGPGTLCEDGGGSVPVTAQPRQPPPSSRCLSLPPTWSTPSSRGLPSALQEALVSPPPRSSLQALPCPSATAPHLGSHSSQAPSSPHQ